MLIFHKAAVESADEHARAHAHKRAQTHTLARTYTCTHAARDTFEASPVSAGQVSIEDMSPQLVKPLSKPSPTTALRAAAPAPEVCVCVIECVCMCVCVCT